MLTFLNRRQLSGYFFQNNFPMTRVVVLYDLVCSSCVIHGCHVPKAELVLLGVELCGALRFKEVWQMLKKCHLKAGVND
jgi:hypothetical protein